MKSMHISLKENKTKNKLTKKNEYAYEKDFVEKNLIAYIGNKRRLLPLLLRGLEEIKKNGSKKINDKGLFVDYFSGTGVVSRLAKSLGFSVVANDWEQYSKIINEAFLLNDSDFLKTFDNEGGIEKVLQELNGLTKNENGKDGYITTYYCPKEDSNANGAEERMFYTRENGILIDNIRQEIERRYTKNNDEENKKKKFLLALLLIQGSKRSNTSGVFKGFHCGFGGKKGDALNRILHPITLEVPTLTKKGGKNNKVYCENALDIKEKIGNKQIEIAYLDPPYNQHQYGSNYHLLNTIALNDQPAIEKKFWIDGKKINKSGIRKDWKKTRSNFCYRTSALKEFQTLLKSIDAKYIVVSYSIEGIIDFEEIFKALSQKGRLAIVTQSYTRFRGGRQCNATTKKNLEFILIVDTNLVCREKDLENIRGIIALDHIQIAWQEPLIVWEKEYFIKENKENKCYFLHCVNEKIKLRLDSRLCLTKEGLSNIFSLPFSQQTFLVKKMEKIAQKPSHEKIKSILKIIRENKDKKSNIERKFLMKEIDRLLQKINPKKTPDIYKNTMKALHFFKNTFSKQNQN